MRRLICCFIVSGIMLQAEVERVWVSCRRSEFSHVVICWETSTPCESIVHYGSSDVCLKERRGPGSATRHAVEIPLPETGPLYYRVVDGENRTGAVELPDFRSNELRLAVVGNWSSRRPLDALRKDAPHLLLTAGDNVPRLWDETQRGNRSNLAPYRRLLDTYPEFLPRVVLMPVLGNHDREILPRGERFPPEPTYDPDAVAFRTFFELPDDEWKWALALPGFGVRLIALDLNHTSDMGTTWQTCHPFAKDSEQFSWFDHETSSAREPFVIALQNEQNCGMRGKEQGAWKALFGRCNAVVTGFGYYAEHAEVDQTVYLNTSLNGHGTQYKDPAAVKIVGEDTYLLLTVARDAGTMTAAFKNLDGAVVHQLSIPARKR